MPFHQIARFATAAALALALAAPAFSQGHGHGHAPHRHGAGVGVRFDHRHRGPAVRGDQPAAAGRAHEDLLAVAALAGPTWERQPQPLYRAPIDRVIVLDMSPSMAVAPS